MRRSVFGGFIVSLVIVEYNEGLHKTNTLLFSQSKDVDDEERQKESKRESNSLFK